MRKTSKPFLILFAVLLLVMSLPVATSERLRGLVAAMLSPIWEIFSPLQIHGKQVPVEGPTYKDFQKLEVQTLKSHRLIPCQRALSFALRVPGIVLCG